MTTNPPPGKSGPRPGGRSARVQAAVHAAVRDLQRAGGRSALTVPAIAASAGVTPSTIYRRWGDLSDLLADVAVEHLRPDMEPPDTGTLAGDLTAWSEQYLDEMNSEVGRAMVRDVLAGSSAVDGQPVPCRCFAFTASQIDTILARAHARGDADVPARDMLMDGIVAPVVYRLLFAPEPPDAGWLKARLRDCLSLPPPAVMRGPKRPR